MSTSEERGRLAADVELTHQQQIELAQTLNDRGYSNFAIAHIMRIDESTVRSLVVSAQETIEWGHNCLTAGIHHGRPEPLWNLPLLYAATVMFRRDELKTLVLERIHQDAMQFVEHSPFVQKGTENSVRFTQEWADRVKEISERKYDTTLQHKIGELSKYYETHGRRQDVHGMLHAYMHGTLNRGYQPLHGHDSINLLCRILGTSASIKAGE